MLIRFSHPHYLLLLPLVWAYTWWVLRDSLADLGRGRRQLAGGLRFFLLTLIVLALSGVQLIRPTSTLCTAFVVDVSDSISPAERDIVLSYIHQSVKAIRPGDSAALVAFGAEALLDHAPEDRDAIRKIYSIPSTSRTDIAAGMQLAMASFPQSSGKQIVLFTDGNENLGNAAEQAGLAETNGVRISVVPLQRDISRGESLLLRADAPPEVREGAPFQISVLAESQEETDGTATLYRNNQPIEAQKVHLNAGKTAIAFQETVGQRGLFQYKVLLDVPRNKDTVPDNNVAAVSTHVAGKPTMLLVEGVPGDGKLLAQALRAHDMVVELGGVDRIPSSVESCAMYDSVVFINVPAWHVTPMQMAILRSAVKDTGMGFAMLGGEQSFGAGGYYRTPIEEILPVTMDVRKKKEFPSVALALVIEDLELQTIVNTAIEAARASVDLLQPIDYVGVVDCNEGWSGNTPQSKVTWRIPLQQIAANRESIKGKMSTLTNMGDPGSYVPALLQAAHGLLSAKAPVKHIILVGDGDAQWEQTPGDYTRTLTRLRAQGITVSTIDTGIDGPPCANFMRRLAQLGGGQYYLTKRAEDLPRLLTRDQQTISKPPIVEEPFRVNTIDSSHPVTRGIDWASAPPLLGYVATSPRENAPTASLLMVSHKDDPVLAVWPYGLGHTLAFTSDATGHWGAHWLSWERYSGFWAQALRWTIRQSGRANFQTTLREDHGRVTVNVEAVTPEGEFRNLLNLRAHVTHIEPGGIEGAQASDEELELTQTAPGHYEGDFEARRTGSYLVTVDERDGGKSQGLQMVSLAIPYSPEYQALKPDLPLLEHIAKLAHGEMTPSANDVYGRLRFGSRTLQDLWPILLTVLAVLFLLDVAVRRILLPWTEVFTLAWRAIAGRLPRWSSPATAPAASTPHTEMLGSLLHVRGKVRDLRESDTPTLLTPGAPPPTETKHPSESAAPADTTPTATVGTLLQKKKERKQ